jgi:NifU-like protein involved in Fe-S cluster formation
VNYSELTLRYFQTAASAGVLTGRDVYRGRAGSRTQGASVQFDVQVNAGMIEAARFLAFGCPHTIAVSSWVAEQGVGLVVTAALPQSVQELSDRFAVPVEKRGRLLIIEDAWVAALTSALQRSSQTGSQPL